VRHSLRNTALAKPAHRRVDGGKRRDAIEQQDLVGRDQQLRQHAFVGDATRRVGEQPRAQRRLSAHGAVGELGGERAFASVELGMTPQLRVERGGHERLVDQHALHDFGGDAARVRLARARLGRLLISQ
jgi:hypothetical protein